MQINYDKFNQVLTHIERNPREWDQSWPFFDRREDCSGCLFAHARFMFNTRGDAGVLPDGAKALGINDAYGELSQWLFDSSRTLDDFRPCAPRARLSALATNGVTAHTNAV